MHHSMYTRVPTLISDAFNLHDSAVKSEPVVETEIGEKSSGLKELPSDDCESKLNWMKGVYFCKVGDMAKGGDRGLSGEPSFKSALSYIYPNLLYNVSIWLASTLQSSK